MCLVTAAMPINRCMCAFNYVDQIIVDSPISQEDTVCSFVCTGWFVSLKVLNMYLCATSTMCVTMLVSFSV